MQKNNFINSALKVIQIEGKAILGLQDQIEETFNDLCLNIIATKGKLILMGIGKSGHIAQKISATLSSTGTPSFFIHPTEAAHGDLGMIDKKDAILILSNFIPTIYFGVFTGLAMLLARVSVLNLLPSLILLIQPFGSKISS